MPRNPGRSKGKKLLLEAKFKPKPTQIHDYVTVVQEPLGAYSQTIGPLMANGEHSQAGLFDIAKIVLDEDYIIVTVESLNNLIERLQHSESVLAVTSQKLLEREQLDKAK